MKFGIGSNTELTQKYARVKVQKTYVCPHIYKQISPILNLTPMYSVSLANYICMVAKSLKVRLIEC